MKNIIKTVFAGIFTLVFFAACDMGNKTALLDILSQKEVGAPEKIAAVNLISGERRKNVKEEVFNALGIAAGNMTASDAAKKIAAASNMTVDGIAFEENRALAYDDKDGTFIVSVKGTKDGVRFETRIEANGFTHPYNSSPQSEHSVKFNFSEAIEENMSLTKYLEKVRADIKTYLTFSYFLENGKEIVLGEHSAYSLTADVTLHNEKLKIVPKYVLNYKTLILNSGDEIIKSEEYRVIRQMFSVRELSYFEEKDVFQYVLEKVKGDFVNVNNKKFASEFYAKTKSLRKTPQGLLKTGDGSVFKKYADKYKTKDGEKFLELKMAACIYNIDGGINADDYSGSLSVEYCIAKEEDIEDLHTSSAVKNLALSKTETYSGFLKINEQELRKMFTFTLIKGDGSISNEDRKKKWQQDKIIDDSLVKGEFGSYQVTNILKTPGENSYYLTVNSEVPDAVFALAQQQNLSKGINDELILITGIQVKKEKGKKELNITCYFHGQGEPVTLSIEPLI
ncbi:hypothetical protein [Treponema pedis]|uniref:hypothetical protein n=1 Tax=Treponema pedis TaxID=409322 RepID=UPI00042354B3|nr:hypothetical protein [Treponema pedis]